MSKTETKTEPQIWILEGNVRLLESRPAHTSGHPIDERNGHSPDFASVVWNNQYFELTRKQRIVIQLLWEAMEDGMHVVSGGKLQEAAECSKMSSIFRDHPAWGRLIVPGERHDTYRLAPKVD